MWQLTLPLARSGIDPGDLPGVIESFHRLHEKHYSVRAETDPVEFTEWNLIATGRTAVSNKQATPPDGAKAPALQPSSRRRVFLREAGGAVDIPVFEVDALAPGASLEGPALIQDQLTVRIGPTQRNRDLESASKHPHRSAHAGPAA